VVFEDGLARKSEYRRFAVRSPGQDDVGSIHEVITRRFRRYLEERIDTAEVEVDTAEAGDPDPELSVAAPMTPIDPETGRPRKFAYPPQLVVVDGGAPQVAAAAAAMAALGIDDIALCGLAKRLEEVWLPGNPDPIILPRTSEALYMLQRVRDEAHRFAITYHRQRRSKGMVDSVLDGIPGLGETRRKALMRKFGSVKRLRAATIEEIEEVPGLGRRTAEAIHLALAAAGPAQPAVDAATGEILEPQDTAHVSVAGSGGQP
jgi:excinuclease ABC subunit C